MKKGFTIPKSLLTQLNECTSGYLLISIDDNGDFNLHIEGADQLVVYSGLLNYAAMQTDCLLEELQMGIAQQTSPLEDSDSTED